MEYMEGKVGIVFNPEKVRGDIYDAASSTPTVRALIPQL
jgi:hypothetical protein